MNCIALAKLIDPPTDADNKYIIQYTAFQNLIEGNDKFQNERCNNTLGKPIHVQKTDGTTVAIKAANSNIWVKQQIPNEISFDSKGGRKSRRHKRKTLKRKTKRRRYKHRRSRRTRR